MAQDENPKKVEKNVGPSEPPSCLWLLGAFWLFQFVLWVGTSLLVAFTNSIEHPTDFPTSPFGITCLIAWSGGAAYVWSRLKFSPKAATFPFFLATGFWMLSFLGRADTPAEIFTDDGAHRMFYSCLTILMVCIIRCVLGEGRQQTETLKQMVRFFVPDLKKAVALPQESLLRAASRPETPHETLLRPAKEATASAPEQLLRSSQPEEGDIVEECSTAFPKSVATEPGAQRR